MHGKSKIDLASALALRPQWLKENLPRFLWRENETPEAITRLDILNIWESAKRVTVLYEIGLNGAPAPGRQQIYVGHVVGGDRLAEECEKALEAAVVQPPQGRALTVIPEAEMYLLAFPNDRKMRLLAEVELRAWLDEHLREVAGNELEGKSWQIQETKVEMLRYVPDKRFTAHCRAKIKTAEGVEKEISFIAKQLSDEKKAKKLYRNLLALRRAWADQGSGLRSRSATPPPIRLPRALAFDEKNAIVFIEMMPGKNLKQVLFDIDPARVMPAVGDLLANLHLAKKRVRKKVSLRNEVAEVREIMGNLVAAFPQLRPRLKELFGKLKMARWQDAAPPVLLHGTFRLNHIFIHDGQLALLDLDSMRVGHPAYDLANFLSSLYYLEAQQRIDASQRRNIARDFLAGYAAKAPWEISPAAVLWFLSSLLINKQAGKYVAHVHEDREEKVKQMLALAEAALERCRPAPNNLTLTALWKVLP